MLLLDRPASEVLHASLTLAEFLALPEDTRCEIVDGILRPMATPSDVHREVQKYLTWRLTEQRPTELRVSWELSVIFQIIPPTAYIPDVLVYRPRPVRTSANSVPCGDVLIAAEIVSPGSQTDDRITKPVQYALNGIPHYWRIELDPELEIHTHRLVDSAYEPAGKFGRGTNLADPELPWLDIDVDGLLGEFG
ncbi:MAG: Uma2 family endonuclease [Natronosporangium sp.]